MYVKIDTDRMNELIDALKKIALPSVSDTIYNTDDSSDLQSITVNIALTSRIQESDQFLTMFKGRNKIEEFIISNNIRGYHVTNGLILVDHDNNVYKYDAKTETFSVVTVPSFIPGYLLQSVESLLSNITVSMMKYSLCVLRTGVKYTDENKRRFFPKANNTYPPIFNSNEEEYILMHCEDNGKTYAFSHCHIMSKFKMELI